MPFRKEPALPPFPRAVSAALIALAAALAAPTATARALDVYLEGDPAGPAPAPVSGGLLLIGGGDRTLEAMRWFIAKAGHGHIVILRASQHGEAGTEFYREIGGVLSAETFVTHARSASRDPHLLAALGKADGIYIAGGDQARYVRRWRGTPIAEALDAHVRAGKPLAGTSAGLAILGEYLYGAMDGQSLTSVKALADPFGKGTTIETGFLHLDLLKGVITDSHFTQRDRLGRLFAFLAKAQASRPADAPPLLGLGIDEGVALAVEPDGTGRVYPSTPGTGVSIVSGAALPRLAAPGPLVAARVRVTIAGPQSLVRLPAGKVEDPIAEKNYSAAGGTITALP
ncbi:cyanophycinase [Novosphingobium sp.]|uniref:cyanophycinase n=1 Tax=Novosphingobium sp. TaxID=1874826 RepID=UPI0025EB3582|nr:cyanophycinase [Novosphingobium sp.]